VYEATRPDAPPKYSAVWLDRGGLTPNEGLFQAHCEGANSLLPPPAVANSPGPVLDLGSHIRMEVLHLQLELKFSNLDHRVLTKHLRIHHVPLKKPIRHPVLRRWRIGFTSARV
jgi:hypothetical protein